MSWRISPGKVRLLSRAPPCSSDERGFACRVFQTHPLCEPEYAGGHRFLWLAPLRSREIRRVGGSLRIILAPATTSTVLVSAHSSVRSRRARFCPGNSPPPFRDNSAY